MPWVLVLVALLVGGPAFAAKKKKKPRRAAPPAASQQVSSPAQVPAAPAPASPPATPVAPAAVSPPAAPPPRPGEGEVRRPASSAVPPQAAAVMVGKEAVSFALGYFYGGGFNRGPWALVAWATPYRADRLKLGADVELSYRLSTFRRHQPGYGPLSTSLHAVPLLAVARWEALTLGPLALDARVGLGPMFLVHHLGSTFSAPSTRFAVGWDVFAGGQLRLRLLPFELFVDARYGLGEARMPFVVGRTTGLQGALGMRFALR